MKETQSEILKNVEMVIFDFDGVFTTNQVIVMEDGKEGVICNRSDGLGLNMLRGLGIKMAIVSTEKNPVVIMRAKKLKLVCYVGLEVKEKKVQELAKENKISLSKIAYVGNDINDLGCLGIVGVPIAVADAYPEVIKVSKIVLSTRGGYGAVRELCELIREEQNER